MIKIEVFTSEGYKDVLDIDLKEVYDYSKEIELIDKIEHNLRNIAQLVSIYKQDNSYKY